MKKSKKFLAAAMALIIAFSLSSVSFAAKFSDTAGHKLEKYINKGVELGFINGMGDGTFKPDSNLTRAQFCKMINYALGMAGYSDKIFPDVAKTDWFFNDISTAVSMGYIYGKKDGTFAPNEPVTRYQVALMLSRIAKPNSDTEYIPYSDENTVPDWAMESVVFARNSGLFDAFIDDVFNGASAMTRAEAAAVIVSLTESFDKLPVFVSPCVYSDTGVLFKNYTAERHVIISGKNLFDSLDLEQLEEPYLSAPQTTEAVQNTYDKLKGILDISVSNLSNCRIVDLNGNNSNTVFSTYNILIPGRAIELIFLIAPADIVPSSFTVNVSLLTDDYTISGPESVTFTSDKLGELTSSYTSQTSFMRVKDNLPQYLLKLQPADGVVSFNSYLYFSDTYGEHKTERQEIDLPIYTDSSNAIYIDYTDAKKSFSSHTGYGVIELEPIAAKDSINIFNSFAMWFDLNKGLELLHDGLTVDEIGSIKRGEEISLQLKLTSFEQLTAITANLDSFSMDVTVLDANGVNVSDGFTLSVASQPISLGEQFSLKSLSIGTINEPYEFARLQSLNSAEPGVYSYLVRIIYYDSQDNKYIVNAVENGVFTLS